MKRFAKCKHSQEKRNGYFGKTNFHISCVFFQTKLKLSFVVNCLFKDVCIERVLEDRDNVSLRIKGKDLLPSNIVNIMSPSGTRGRVVCGPFKKVWVP